MPEWGQFPQELIDAIVDEVHHPCDLKSCSLVSRAFSSRTRVLLFRHVNLRYTRSGGKSVFTNFHDLCVSSPHFSASIKILGISEYHLRTPPSASGILDLIIQSLPNLIVIKLFDVRIGYFLNGSLACLSSHPFLGIHLDKVTFDNIDQFYDLISGSPRLKSLTLSGAVSVSNPESRRSTVYRALPQVEHLVLKFNHDPAHRVGALILESIFRQGGCPFSVERVRRLTIEVNNLHKVQFDRANAILAATSQTLQELTVVLHPFTRSCSSPCHILCFASIRKVCFSFMHAIVEPLWWFIRNLIHVRDKVGRSTVEELTLQITSVDAITPAKEWTELDEILSSTPFSDTFQSLHITNILILKPRPELQLTSKTQRAQFEPFFPLLTQRGKVSFSLMIECDERDQYFTSGED
ncbi:uncharacterized protein EV420DRAFT_1639754 [Desarmillaria tabescens]|uniref:F-box domain-containing protein n=1 Tax=Armillaria tabescens TaxID=1929756 RepID=A0AA39NBF7_ARMTA|nr:uncharacterized protein EV420DRAFT_1639754 [Desarmillaria tabescens]KAK0462543.1 hypothetical protein EV420DRAFT_1639754 [Desarmillaria tabescens]